MIFVWRMMQNKDVTSIIPLTSFQAHKDPILRCLLSPDIHHLATCSADHNARIWSVIDPGASNPNTDAVSAEDALQNLERHAPDLKGTQRSDGAFPLETNLGQHQRWVWDCAFSADSAYLVTSCSDHYARLWELSSSTIIRQYNGHHRGCVCIALNDYSI